MLQQHPRLRQLDDFLQARRGDASWADYERAKQMLAKLVGFHAGDDCPAELRSPLAYEAAIQHITDTLEV